MTRRDIALRGADGDIAALVTITPMAPDDEATALADDARETLVEAFDADSTPVEVGRDE